MMIEMINCQKIVDKLINLLGININIMNEKGIIIASGDKTRIQMFHEAANSAITQKQEVVVDDLIIRRKSYKGAQAGINLPIYYNGQVVGVVGITGDPLKVKDLGIIVKELVELMIQEEERKKLELYHSRSMVNFAKELIKDHSEKDKDIFSYRSQLVDFKMDIPRVVIVADAVFFSSYVQDYGEDTAITKEIVKQSMIDIMNRLSKPSMDLAINIYMDRFVIFKNCNEDIEEFCQKIQKEISNKFIIKLTMGVGSVCKKIEDYSKSYILASRVVNIGKKIHPEKNVYFIKDYKIQMMLNHLTHEQREEYFSNIGFLDLAKEKEADSGTKEILHTIKVYFESGMNIQNTANKLFVHRNTVNYRINKFKDTFDIDINNAFNCSMIYLGINMLELR